MTGAKILVKVHGVQYTKSIVFTILSIPNPGTWRDEDLIWHGKAYPNVQKVKNPESSCYRLPQRPAPSHCLWREIGMTQWLREIIFFISRGTKNILYLSCIVRFGFIQIH